ncbi:MAG: hypothetical protein ACREPV_06840 [Lysobacter sp.]
MHACRIAVATALLSMAVAAPFAAESASLRVGITIVEACNIRTTAFDSERERDPVQADCSADTPYSVALGDRSMPDGRSRPALVPDDGKVLTAGKKVRIATFTF